MPTCQLPGRARQQRREHAGPPRSAGERVPRGERGAPGPGGGSATPTWRRHRRPARRIQPDDSLHRLLEDCARRPVSGTWPVYSHRPAGHRGLTRMSGSCCPRPSGEEAPEPALGRPDRGCGWMTPGRASRSFLPRRRHHLRRRAAHEKCRCAQRRRPAGPGDRARLAWIPGGRVDEAPIEAGAAARTCAAAASSPAREPRWR